MGLITIEVLDEEMIVHEGEKLSGSRLVWSCSDLAVWVKGPLNGLRYEQASNLALNVCYDRHIPALSLKRVNSSSSNRKSFETNTRSLWENK